MFHIAVIYWISLGLLLGVLERKNPDIFYFPAKFGRFLGLLIAISYLLVYLIAFIYDFMLYLLIVNLSLVITALVVDQIKKFNNDQERTNIDALIGLKGIVVSEISIYKNGYVKIEGELWLAKGLDNQTMLTGAIVEIVGVAGCHVVVKATI